MIDLQSIHLAIARDVRPGKLRERTKIHVPYTRYTNPDNRQTQRTSTIRIDLPKPVRARTPGRVIDGEQQGITGDGADGGECLILIHIQVRVWTACRRAYSDDAGAVRGTTARAICGAVG